jgi:hypothetical protein
MVLSVLASTRRAFLAIETNLEKLQMEKKGMHGVDDSFSGSVYNVLKIDLNLYRQYHSDYGRQKDLCIGFYDTTKIGKTAHTPIGCLPSQGWDLQESREIKLKSPYCPDAVSANHLLSKK